MHQLTDAQKHIFFSHQIENWTTICGRIDVSVSFKC